MTAAADTDSYLAALPPDQCTALADLRTALRQELPEAEEVISYAMPGLRLGGRMVAGYGAFKNHLGFYPHSGGVIPQLASEIDGLGFKRSKSGVLFTPNHPLPRDLLRRILTLRLAEAGLT